MSLIAQTTHRLEELVRAGLVPSKERSSRGPAAIEPPEELWPTVPMNWLAERAETAESAPPEPPPPHGSTAPAIDVILDLARLEQLGHLVPTQTRSPLAEQFRHIKRPLLKNARSKDSIANRLSLIMVTSALPGEGKTFCAINLAMSLASEIDTSVLLVDADVVRPASMQRMGLQAEKGLLDVLTDTSLDLSDLILRTNVPKLSILPAGPRNHRSTELLASDAMNTLLLSLLSRYPDCIVIFDAPPLLVTNEATVLASLVGQVMLVVEASKTPRSAIAQAFAALEQCPIVMSVLNKAPEPAAGYGYYYG